MPVGLHPLLPTKLSQLQIVQRQHATEYPSCGDDPPRDDRYSSCF
jgi:hypothetical protein